MPNDFDPQGGTLEAGVEQQQPATMLGGANPTQAGLAQETSSGAPWWESLPDELKNEPTVRKYTSVEEAIKGLVNASKLIGKEKVPIPKPDSPQEEWDLFYRAIGRPDTPDGYDVKIEGADEEILNEFKQFAHQKGLTKQQVEALGEFWNNLQQKSTEMLEQQIEQLRETALTELQKEWGKDFDKELEVARRAVQALADEETMELLNAGLGNDPRVIRLFNKVGKMLGEDTLSALPAMSGHSADAKAELAKLKTDPEFIQALQDPMNPAHEEAVKKFKRLHELAFGS